MIRKTRLDTRRYDGINKVNIQASRAPLLIYLNSLVFQETFLVFHGRLKCRPPAGDPRVAPGQKLKIHIMANSKDERPTIQQKLTQISQYLLSKVAFFYLRLFLSYLNFILIRLFFQMTNKLIYFWV